MKVLILLIFNLSMAISNMVAFILIDDIINYFNLIISCLNFVCVGMGLKEIIDKTQIDK